MTKLVFPHPEMDLGRLQWGREIQWALASAGYDISIPDAVLAWEAYSESMMAGWINHDGIDGKTIFYLIEPYVQVIP